MAVLGFAPVRAGLATAAPLLGFLLVLPAGSRAGEPPAPGDVLARVGSRSITVADFTAEMRRRDPGGTGGFASPERRAALLEALVRTELLHGAALREGYDKRPDLLEAYRRLLIGAYREEQLEPALEQLAVTDEEVAARYQASPQSFAAPDQVRAAVIRVALPKPVSAEKKAELRKRAEAARAEALRLGAATPTFGSVAVTYSDDQATRYRGGDTGLMRVDAPGDRWEPAVMEAIRSLEKPGEVSPVIATDTGYHLVKLVERKDGAVPPLEEVRGKIRSRLLAEKRREAEKAFYDRLAAATKVQVDAEALTRVAPPGEGPAPAPPALPR